MKKILAALAALAGTLAVLASSSVATGANPRASLAGSVPSWATSANFKSAADPSSYVNFRVYLGLRDAAAAEALALAVSTPGNAQYGKFLTPGQFQSRFSPAASDVNAVRSWLQSQGFTIDYTPTNNHYIAAEGTVAQVQAAFATQLNLYSVNGRTLRAPASTLSIPSSLASVVQGVIGVDQSLSLLQPYVKADPDATPSAGFRNAGPLSDFWAQKTTANTPAVPGRFLPNYRGAAQPWATHGYTPAQLRGAYGLSGVNATGAGTTVAVVDAYASPTILEDVNQYSSHYGLPAMDRNSLVQIVAPGTYNHPEAGIAQDPQGWYGEETLDVEAVHSMAPGAKIVYFGTPNNYRDLDALLNHVVDRRIADIVTNSYGYSTELLPFGYLGPLNATFLQGALEGMSFLFSSGDSGDETLGTTTRLRTPDWPAVSPWVTAVGGTSLAVGASNNYLFETYWGTMRNRLNCTGFLSSDPVKKPDAWCTKPETYLYGGGGGTSRIFPEPSWQKGIADAFATNNNNGFAGRVVPDISAVGDPNTGMMVGQTQQFPDGTYYDEYRIGGTSLSSPLMAGMIAVAQQRRGGSAFGFLNPALYSLNGSPAYHDITSPASDVVVVRADYANSVDASAGILYSTRRTNTLFTLTSAPGYDDSTGVGTPNGAAFFNALASK